MIYDAIEKYQLIMRLTKTADINLPLLNSLLNMVGVNVPEPVKEQLIRITNSLASEKNYTNLLQVAKDPEFMALVANVHKDMTEGGFALDLDGDGHEDVLSLDSVVKCAHCHKPFALLDADGLREKLEL